MVRSSRRSTPEPSPQVRVRGCSSPEPGPGRHGCLVDLIMFNNVVDSGPTSPHRAGPDDGGLIADPVRGVGLVGRALPEGLAAPALYAVIAYQALSVVLLWTATVAHVRLLFGRGDGARATFVGNIALCALAGLALMFLLGGLWFGYWIAMPAVQQVHFTLLIVAIGAMVLVNMPRTTPLTGARPDKRVRSNRHPVRPHPTLPTKSRIHPEERGTWNTTRPGTHADRCDRHWLISSPARGRKRRSGYPAGVDDEWIVRKTGIRSADGQIGKRHPTWP